MPFTSDNSRTWQWCVPSWVHGLAGLQVNIQDGSVADTYLLQDDFVHASHNFGIHLWDDLLLVVGVSRCWSISAMLE